MCFAVGEYAAVFEFPPSNCIDSFVPWVLNNITTAPQCLSFGALAGRPCCSPAGPLSGHTGGLDNAKQEADQETTHNSESKLCSPTVTAPQAVLSPLALLDLSVIQLALAIWTNSFVSHLLPHCRDLVF